MNTKKLQYMVLVVSRNETASRRAVTKFQFHRIAWSYPVEKIILLKRKLSDD